MAPRNSGAVEASAGAGAGAPTLRKWKPSEITRDHIVINNKVYDVAAFAAEHPGGRVILSMVGEDATDAFRAFHRGSERSYAWLPRLCVGELTAPLVVPDAFEQDCRALSDKLLADGMYKAKCVAPHTLTHTHARTPCSPTHPLPTPRPPRSVAWYITKFLINATLVAGSAVVAWQVDSFWVRMLCAMVMGLGFQQFGWMAHEYGHHQVFKSHDVNDAVLLFACIFLGFDRDWWSLKHNTHHALPNVHESAEEAHGAWLHPWRCAATHTHTPTP